VKFSTKLGGQAGGQPKIWGGHGPPRPSLRTATGKHQGKAQLIACNYLEFLL